MQFIVILISLVLDRWTSVWKYSPVEKVFEPYLALMQKLFRKEQWKTHWDGILLLFPLLIVVELVYLLLFHLHLMALVFLFNLVVFIFCLKTLRVSDFHDALSNVFSVIFWYLALGPIGAVLYRFNDFMKNHHAPYSQVATDFAGVLDWIPARLMTLSFALVSHFLAVMHYWRQLFFIAPSGNGVLVEQCGYAALGDTKEVSIHEHFSKQIFKLIVRALIVWMVILALIVLV
ncbi:MAG: hypothetical protein ABIH77_03110 [Pseudomonadota bacterium]|nr:hypothetical protein [Gammaproteobacteria bacterium]MBU1558877.1 hypothetical protein [Gammaproteobacteria bacterium]MBU1628495.1 hypothetical protein [Gammaproteobacteria bacterium]MBU1927298.1 hypothetical protein [Gammaproteobacteria bacterium]MBU2546094.1 hypothetical protein [Gammaproteobacteria bacterium]